MDETYPTISILNLYTKYYSFHRLQTTIDAQVADRYENSSQPYLEFPQGVKVIFYDRLLNEKSFLEADYAIYYQKKKLWEARKNVCVTSETGTKLQTEQLFGDEGKNKIFSVKHTKVTEPDGSVIEGKRGFESNTSFSNYKFLDVNGIVKLSNEYGNDISVTQSNTSNN